MPLPPLQKSKSSFAGGVNFAVEPYKLGEDQMPYLSNARARYNSVETIPKPLLDVNGLQGVTKFQGLYAAGRYALVFGDGKAYYKDYDVVGASWQEIPGFQMSAIADRIYAVLVPASSTNYLRKSGSTVDAAITLTSTLSGTPQCIVCQDGQNQPRVINFDLSARALFTYGEWSIDNQEYVPVGRQMLFDNTRLYIVSADGRKLYRSVSGRPLNFMVVIDANGNKLPSETDGGAEVVSHAVDYETITCLGPANTPEGEFFVSTLRNSYFVSPNFNSTLFGEPTFDNNPLFNTGAVNQDSYIQLTGDIAFIDIAGIRSYNAVLQTRTESRNNPFAARIYPWFQSVLQVSTACVFHDDYAFFAVNTIYGRAIVVYDTLRAVWESIDFWTFSSEEEYVTMFAELKTSSGERLLLALTSEGVYRAFGSTLRENASIYVGDWTTGALTIEQKPELLKLLFSETRETGTVYASIFVDGKNTLQLNSPVNQSAQPLVNPIVPPFGTDADVTQIVSLDLGRARQGSKVGILIEWDFNATLDQVDYRAGLFSARASLQEMTTKEAGYRDGVPEVLAFTPSSGGVGTIITLIGENLETVEELLVGSVPAVMLTQAPTQIQFIIPDGSTSNKIQLRNESVTVFSDSQLVVT